MPLKALRVEGDNMSALHTLLLAAAAIIIASTSQAQQGTEIGTIHCPLEGGGSGLLRGVGEGLLCTFHPTESTSTDSYIGVIQAVDETGEITPDTTIRWVVMFMGTSGYSPGQLEGDYVRHPAREASEAPHGILIGSARGDVVLIPADDSGEVNIASRIGSFQLRTVKA